MRRAVALGKVAGLLLAAATLLVVPAGSAAAHPLSTSAVLLDIGADRVAATIELPLDQLSVAENTRLTATTVLAPRTLAALRAYVGAHLSATDARHRSWTTDVVGGRVSKVDGVDTLVLAGTLAPVSGPVGDFVLHDDVVVDRLVSHRIFVSARYGDAGAYTTLAMLSWQTRSVPVASNGAAPRGQGFVAAVGLGIHHIATGSDHLLFLLMLLLPAPLLVRGHRWVRRPDPRRSGWRVVHVVTAFAIGHSCTLALGALGWVQAPTRLVESGIALSVLVSALHAIRPLVRRGEVLIAGGFGLLHGLSFAALLVPLDLSRGALVSTLLGFNLGIELTQLLVVALVMPSLVLLSRSAAYAGFRVAGAGLGAVLAAGWLLERTGVISADPGESLARLLVDHPLVLAAGLAAASLAVAAADGRRRCGAADPPSDATPARSVVDDGLAPTGQLGQRVAPGPDLLG